MVKPIVVDNIPLLTDRDEATGKYEWPFADMICGQSFEMPVDVASRLRKAASAWKRRHVGWDYVIRPQHDGSLRLWCVSIAAPAVKPTVIEPEPIDDSVPETWVELQVRLAKGN